MSVTAEVSEQTGEATEQYGRGKNKKVRPEELAKPKGKATAQAAYGRFD